MGISNGCNESAAEATSYTTRAEQGQGADDRPGRRMGAGLSFWYIGRVEAAQRIVFTRAPGKPAIDAESGNAGRCRRGRGDAGQRHSLAGGRCLCLPRGRNELVEESAAAGRHVAIDGANVDIPL